MFGRWAAMVEARCRLLFRADPGADPRSFGGLLGGLFVAVGSLVAAGTVWLLPAGVNRSLTLSLCAAGLLGALVIVGVPWQRWPVEMLLVVPVVGQAFLGLSWWLVPGTGVHYFGLVVLAYSHAGLTQRRGISVVLMPVTMIAAVVGDGWSINTAIVTFIGVAVAESLALLSQRQRHTHTALTALLGVVRQLSAAADVDQAAGMLSSEALTVLDADMALVYTADAGRPGVYSNRSAGAQFEPMDIDIHGEPSGVGVAVRSGRPLFVGDAAGSPEISQRLVAATGMRSALYVPLAGTGRPAGVLVVGWRHARRRVGQYQSDIIEISASEAGRVIERLINAQLLTEQTLTDPLTGVGNRRYWEHHLTSVQPGDAVVLLDLDRFKMVNDRYGHQTGDNALCQIAACLLTAARANDVVARIGGDEFGIILRSAGAGGARSLADRLAALWDAADRPVSYSIGWATHNWGDGAQTTVANADRNLYNTKTERHSLTGRR